MKLNAQAEAQLRLQKYGASRGIDGVARVPLRRFNDAGGSMMELLRLPSAPPEGLEGFDLAQLNYSVLHPGVIKAFHLHRRQTDVWFVPPEDRLLLVLADLRDGSPSEGVRVSWMLGDGRHELVRIPPGVAHGCRNLGPESARILYFTDRLFSPDPADCDEGRLPWDYLGADIWEIPRE